ncbi:rhomboid family intramembrane serine protease [Galbibacter sp.]|uniref:rhomboid family intramembrane serine protease n=1 Tax=Galbibacter sp. TaxID=2918471 RepID=UPI003A91F0BC
MNINIVTIVVILANVIPSFIGFKDYSFFERYKFHIGSIKKGERIRILTSGFLHVDVTHLLFNMLTLYFFAPIVVAYFGSVKFLIVYLISLIAGNLLSLNFHKGEYHYSAVGASGAVTGILYAAILLQPDMRLGFFFIPIPIPAYIFGIGYLLYSIYGMRNRVGNIGHSAHFGGAIGGYVITLLFFPSLIWVQPLMVGLLALPIVILFILEKSNKL